MASNYEISHLNDKIIIVTGANTGVGFETALELAKRGAHVVLGCRDANRGKEALDKIKAESSNEHVYLEQLDLADFDCIRDFVKRFRERWQRLDVLVNNAGIVNGRLEKNNKDIEMTFAVNHLGSFLLTNLLLDVLKQSAPSRIVNVSSMAFRIAKINFDDLYFEKKFDGFNAYCQSKLANVYFTLELAKRLEGTNVTVVALHPGTVKTEIFRNSSGFIFGIIKNFATYFAKTPKQGAQTSIYCATSNDVSNHTGAFYDDSKVFKLPKSLLESPDAARLWDLSEKLVF